MLTFLDMFDIAHNRALSLIRFKGGGLVSDFVTVIMTSCVVSNNKATTNHVRLPCYKIKSAPV